MDDLTSDHDVVFPIWRGMLFQGEITSLQENDHLIFEKESQTLMFARGGIPLRFENKAGGSTDDKRSLRFILCPADFQDLAILLAEINNLPIMFDRQSQEQNTTWTAVFMREGG